MALKRCPICGEKFSDTYRECPFCEEEEALLDGEEIRRMPKRSKRSRSKQFNIVTPTLIVLILIMAALLIYLLYGDKLGDKGKTPDEPDTPPVESEMPEDPVSTGDPEGTMPEDDPGTTETPVPEAGDYDAIMALPDGLVLSTTDFTLRKTGETHTITVSGGVNTYSWASQDDGVASVDATGKVTAISKGTINVVVTDGVKKGVCIVRVTATGGGTTSTTTPEPSTGGSLKAGAAIVINGGNGVRVRSGPSTNDEILATLANGSNLKIIEHASGDWYKISFADVGGVEKTGYMKAEFLQNK